MNEKNNINKLLNENKEFYDEIKSRKLHPDVKENYLANLKEQKDI